MYQSKDHCFVICAYKESPYLEECVRSLLDQTVKTNIYIETSTPNDYIKVIAESYNIPIIVNNGESSCAKDWNYAFEHVDHKAVTIAHQDDIYHPDYAKCVLEQLNKTKEPILVHTNYGEIRDGQIIRHNALLNIKALMNAPFLIKPLQSSCFIRKRILSLGDSICCPSVTMLKGVVWDRPFDEELKCSCDYKTWIEIAHKKGDFIYIPQKLMFHRIYEESHTSIYLKDNIRQEEDLQLMCTLWPKPIARAIYTFYKLSQVSNKQ